MHKSSNYYGALTDTCEFRTVPSRILSLYVYLCTEYPYVIPAGYTTTRRLRMPSRLRVMLLFLHSCTVIPGLSLVSRTDCRLLDRALVSEDILELGRYETKDVKYKQ